MVKVSVCIPTYNRSDYLKYSVNSVLQQTYQDFELIVCDDGSTDNTSDVVNSYDDSRLRYVRHPQNIGRSRNMRSGFDAAEGEYFIKFDDDDAIASEFLAKTVAILDSHAEADFVCTDHWIINAQGEREEAATKANSAKWGKDKLEPGIIANLIEETFVKQSLQVGSTLFRRQCLTEVDYMRPQADGCEDFDLLVRLAIAGFQSYFLPELLMEYRFHGGQTSLKQDIHFLSAKAFCIDSYQFTQPELQALKQEKLGIVKQGLGMRLIEKGESDRGHKLLQESANILGYSPRVYFGLLLSYLPFNLRQQVLNFARQAKPQDYSAQVRDKEVISSE
ncbi:Family 2 glycosyl transferase [Hyella patelloides LEGE 07179]|uniref:Family 2 glycosyl transferase n=1 Tax=Hyella patelloides LEGE 07179 TaxID=945734 RepID=A0A563VJU4_9CYAN|nr:glycosyltransferase [Hyella patelloides]VEP11633.1 Family 2 glycosyl transferase [Hyella patelloides LEGE 07179]